MATPEAYTGIETLVIALTDGRIIRVDRTKIVRVDLEVEHDGVTRVVLRLDGTDTILAARTVPPRGWEIMVSELLGETR